MRQSSSQKRFRRTDNHRRTTTINKQTDRPNMSRSKTVLACQLYLGRITRSSAVADRLRDAPLLNHSVIQDHSRSFEIAPLSVRVSISIPS